MTVKKETDLYEPVKNWLETLGYEVKAEIGAADVVALREGEDPVVVELKTGFSLVLLQQAVARQAVTDNVYVAVPRWRGRAGWKAFKGNIGLCRRLGLGVLSVRSEDGFVQLHTDPKPFTPRKSKARKSAMLKEFATRRGDPNQVGTRGKITTAYRQDAETCAQFLAGNGPSKGMAVAKSTGVSRATLIMAANHYGWFQRVERGVYALTADGQAAMGTTDA